MTCWAGMGEAHIGVEPLDELADTRSNHVVWDVLQGPVSLPRTDLLRSQFTSCRS